MPISSGFELNNGIGVMLVVKFNSTPHVQVSIYAFEKATQTRLPRVPYHYPTLVRQKLAITMCCVETDSWWFDKCAFVCNTVVSCFNMVSGLHSVINVILLIFLILYFFFFGIISNEIVSYLDQS